MISSAVARKLVSERRFLDSVRPLLQLNTAKDQWYQSLTAQPINEREAFQHMKRPLRDEDLIGMLLHDHWIACLRRRDRTTDRLIFDLDATPDGDQGDLQARYEVLRAALGHDREPLVYRTPHGGIHVVYRIPRVSIKPLITGRRSGVVADALRDAGLSIADGSLEIYPQETRAIRIPLGKRMSMLDPETLRPIPGAAVGDSFDLEMLRGAVQHLKRWHATEIDDLITHLGHMASRYRRGGRSEEPPCSAHQKVPRHSRPRASRQMRETVERGLTEPGSRHREEFRVGAMIWADPGLFGLPADPSPEDVAMALAGWVLSHNNGFSKEWAWHRRRCRSDEEAIRSWAHDRYLKRDRNGQTAVDRMRNLGQIQGPARIPSFEERKGVVCIVDAAGLEGPARYRAEVWCMAALRAVREILWWRGFTVRPGETTVIAIASAWMESWPFGAGQVGGSTTAYVAYRGLLERAGVMVTERGHSRYPGNPYKGVATRYRVVMPDAHDASDLGISIAVIKRRIKREKAYGRSLTLDEAIHALHVSRRGDLERYYGAAVAKRIQEIADLLIPRRRFA